MGRPSKPVVGPSRKALEKKRKQEPEGKGVLELVKQVVKKLAKGVQTAVRRAGRRENTEVMGEGTRYD